MKASLGLPRHDAKVPKTTTTKKLNAQSSKPKRISKASSTRGSRTRGLRSANTKPPPKSRPKKSRRDMTTNDYMNLVENKREIYNFCARSLVVPEFTRSTTKHGTSTCIEYPAQNISAKGMGSFWVAELEACLNFRKDMEKKLKEIPNASEDQFVLHSSNGRQLLQFYVQRKRGARLEEKTKEAIGMEAQIWCGGAPIGEPVVSHNKKEAVALAYLTAAVQVARECPSILHDFQHAERGNDGEILHSLRPIDFDIVRDMMGDMERSSRLFLQSASSKVSRKSQQERSWTNVSHSRHSSSENARHRSADLLQRHEAFMADPKLEHMRELKNALPMNQRREEVLKLVNGNTYSIIVGATGSGKTTQVPQIIFEDAVVRNCGADVNIICTQPRRIAAKSVAKRVADERNEVLQKTVGYHVRGDNKTPHESGRMIYCTTGILLKQLQLDPNQVMDSTSHIIIDEVHERDIFIDFLMTTLKKTVDERQRLNKRIPNIVLMSATMDTELFSNYFKQADGSGKLKPCASITVPGRVFPVKEKYLETILDELKQTYSKRHLQILEDRDTKQYLINESGVEKSSTSLQISQAGLNNITTDMKDAIVPVGLVVATIAHIARTTSEGAILAFLPGLQEIVSTEKLLLQNPLGVNFSDGFRYRIFKLHSDLKDKQDEIFDPVPDGCRKIIISTNIAETSVTIPDVQHVVDSGKLREKRYNQLVQITKLQCVWVSKSNMRQRAGRAGRVQNGNYYALYSSSRYNSLETIGLPEMLRSDLMEICLDVKAHSNYSIGEFLRDSIQPPDSSAINASVQDLKDIEALTIDEELTPLGKLLATLPVHPSLGKMIILGVIFRCLDPLLILGAAANERSIFLRPLGSEKEADKDREEFGSGTFSDPLTTINAFREARRNSQHFNWASNRIPKFFQDHFLHFGAFRGISNTMREIENLLGDVGVIPKVSNVDEQSHRECGDASLNRNSGNTSLIRALVLAGHRGNLAVNGGYSQHIFNTQKESRTQIHRGSINSFIGSKSRKDEDQTSSLPSPTILSFGSRHMNDQNNITLRDTSLVSPLIATLFGGPLTLKGTNLITVADRLNFFVKSAGGAYKGAKVVQQFRNGLDILLSNAFKDLAEQTMLADNINRDRFASAIAHVIDQDFKLYVYKGGDRSLPLRRKAGV